MLSMPQMSPLLWLPLLMMNLFMLYMMMSTIHYSMTPMSPSLKSSNSLTISNQNKWNFSF